MTSRSAFREGLFTGRHVVVTGGSSGIGREIAVRFAELGAEVVTVGSREHPGSPPHPRIRFARADVRHTEQLSAALTVYPEIDVVVAAAGVSHPSQEWDEERFADVVDVNLTGALRTVEVTVDRLCRSRGCVITIGSMLSYNGSRVLPAYTASKTGVLGLTRALADRLGPERVRANCIAPGYIATPMTVSLQGDSERSRLMVDKTALRRWGQPADIADAAVFLASPAASYITGATIPVDGGFLVTSLV